MKSSAHQWKHIVVEPEIYSLSEYFSEMAFFQNLSHSFRASGKSSSMSTLRVHLSLRNLSHVNFLVMAGNLKALDQ